ncbi:MAG: 3-deoxy-manno-octulosonate cytidylyltransferase [Bdellovibrionales bacterium CG10_big_fil_rev_8_21_14_0_10_45_34]|nr:MAG: 3-deoxy-manno-octulosonate cytidylyltransferase [Bdellovibrionales bacterium CG10_big_fil_rev_8_21_14_0_10_45_34]
MKALCVIPARYGSTRFPGKPLHPLLGRPLLAWVIDVAKKSRLTHEVIVATDDERILELAKKENVSAVLTDSDLPSGTDRVWKAVEGSDCDIVINLQGDEPTLNPKSLDLLIEALETDSEVQMATLARAILDVEELNSQQTAKIVLNDNSEAIYFSRLPIPFSRKPFSLDIDSVVKHIGVYGFKRSFLQKFCERGDTNLEKSEGLEQLRALVMGARIKVVKVDSESWGVDYPHDVERVEKQLKGRMF